MLTTLLVLALTGAANPPDYSLLAVAAPNYSLAGTPDYSMGTPATFASEIKTDVGPCGIAGCKCGCREGQLCVCYDSRPDKASKPAAATPTQRPLTKTIAKTTPPQGWTCGPNGCYPTPAASTQPRRTTAPVTTYYGGSCANGSCGGGYSYRPAWRPFSGLRGRFGFR